MITEPELEALRKDLTTYKVNSSLWFYNGKTVKSLLDYIDHLQGKLKEKESVKPD